MSAVTGFSVGNPLRITRTITGLPAKISSATLDLKAMLVDTVSYKTFAITPTVSADGQITDTGSGRGDGTFAAQCAFTLTGTDTTTYFNPGVTAWGQVSVRTTAGETYTSESFPITPRIG